MPCFDGSALEFEQINADLVCFLQQILTAIISGGNKMYIVFHEKISLDFI